MTRFLIPLSIIATGLAGCTGSTDPATATLFDNVRNLNSGEYDRQIYAKRAEANSIIAANDRSRANIARMESQRSANASTIASLRGQVASLRSQIASAKASNPGAAAQLNALNSQVSAVQSDVSAGGDPSVASAELARIRRAVVALSS